MLLSNLALNFQYNTSIQIYIFPCSFYSCFLSRSSHPKVNSHKIPRKTFLNFPSSEIFKVSQKSYSEVHQMLSGFSLGKNPPPPTPTNQKVMLLFCPKKIDFVIFKQIQGILAKMFCKPAHSNWENLIAYASSNNYRGFKNSFFSRS